MFVTLLTGSKPITWRMIYGMDDSFGFLLLLNTPVGLNPAKGPAELVI